MNSILFLHRGRFSATFDKHSRISPKKYCNTLLRKGLIVELFILYTYNDVGFPLFEKQTHGH